MSRQNSLHSILVHVDETGLSAGVVEAACTLAGDHDAHLTGLAVDSTVQIPGYAAVEIPDSVLEIIAARQAEALAKKRDAFDGIVARAGLTDRSEWSAVKGLSRDVLPLRSRYADLTVLTQIDSRRESSESDRIAEFVLESGRPALVIPYIGAPDHIGRTVLIAWNGSREAARAVADAMPLLERADSVEVLAVEPRGIGDSPGADIARHLAGHGVKAEARAISGIEVNTGDAILNRAADTGADLIVMGAYGHSRIRELVIGGVTRHIMEHMTVPVLFSH